MIRRRSIMPRDTAAPAQQVGRYSTQSATSPNAASEPLQVVATISYPRATVRTVGDAMNHTLLRTGYRMANDTELTHQAVQFLSLPLPESQRQLGPYTVESILGILLGSPWEIQLQPITRRIQIQLSAAYAGPDAGHSAPTTK